jgi:hypothetical protein
MSVFSCLIHKTFSPILGIFCVKAYPQLCNIETINWKKMVFKNISQKPVYLFYFQYSKKTINSFIAMNEPSIFIGGRKTINPEEVIRLEADINYTYVFFSDGKKIVVATTLKELESRFQGYPKFFRINKSVIINIDSIKRIDEEQIIFQNGETITPSRRRKKAFFEIYNN